MSRRAKHVTHAWTWSGIAAACAASALGFVACLDMRTIDSVDALDAGAPPDEGDAAMLDADAGADVDMRGPCQRCIESPSDAGGGGCGDVLAKCMANARCTGTYACVIAKGCLTKPSRREVVNCGIPCAEEAGVVTQDDPAVPLILAVTDCVNGACAQSCVVDGGP